MVNKNKKTIISTIISLIFSITAVSAAEIWTADILGNPKYDFSPEEIVYIHGRDFSQNSIITLKIIRPDSVEDSFFAISDNIGAFLATYQLDGIKGEYIIYATDGINDAQITFTDAAIWTTDNGCGTPQQDVNHFSINDDVYINGEGFDSRSYNWTITGKPGGASCDPDLAVALGTQFVNSSRNFCFKAYTIQSNDCGEYQVKFEQKGDNFRVEGNACTSDSDCGLSTSSILCVNAIIKKEKIIPKCINNACVLTNITQIKSCGNIKSELKCLDNNITNITIIPNCSNKRCSNITIENVIQTCQFGCLDAYCLNQNQSCGNGIKEGNEQCDDGNNENGDGCSSTCKIEFCDFLCIVPNTLGDTIPENLSRHPAEKSLQGFLDKNNISINVVNEQTNIQIWEMSGPVTLEITYIGGKAIESHTFGYYLNHDSNTFVPLFEDKDNILYNKPIVNPGDKFIVTIDKDVGFAIDSWNGSISRMIFTENFLNYDLNDRVVVFNLCNVYILAFEDIYSDFDYQDMVVSVRVLSCGAERCGNDQVEGDEQCDDGNLINDDGCSNLCKTETCGDGIKQTNEECDDGNTNNDDGCDFICKRECEDKDRDGVCDNNDDCPDSHPNEPVDEQGCDIFQFCESKSCGFDCEQADWKDNEKTLNPKDCRVIFPLSNGIIQQPRCVPTEFNNICAG